MEVKLVCDCKECHSCLLELGCVNILVDIPSKLLRNFAKTLKQPLTCDYDSSCELYEKLNCSEIHVILITNARGFEALDLLSYFYDLNSTHIVCTRPVYVLANIYYQNYSYELSAHGLYTGTTGTNGSNNSNQNHGYDSSTNLNGNLKGGRSSKEGKFKGFMSKKLLNNLKEDSYFEEFSLTDFFNNNLLHLLSYNEVLKVDVTTSDRNHFYVKPENRDDNRAEDQDKDKKDMNQMNNCLKTKLMNRSNLTNIDELMNDFNVELELVAMSSGFSLGSCNYLVKHGNLNEKVVLISKSCNSSYNRYTKPFNYSIFDNLNKDDVVVLLSNRRSNNNMYGYSYGYQRLFKEESYVREVEMVDEGNLFKSKSKQEQKVEENRENKERLLVKQEQDSRKEGHGHESREEDDHKMDLDEYQDAQLFDEEEGYNKDNGKRVDRDKKEMKEDGSVDEDRKEDLDGLGLYCIDKIVKGKNVMIPLDFNYEYLIDLLECLNRCIKKMKKQVFVYCVGKGVEDLFDYIEKCCEWVREERSEYSMHSEDPKSPFPELDEMKLNNQLFVSDSVNGIANLYRVPSVLILVMYNEEELIKYLSNVNNRFLILQKKFLRPFVNNTNDTDNSGGSDNNRNGNSSSTNKTSTTTQNNSNNSYQSNQNYSHDSSTDHNHNEDTNFNYYKVDFEMDLSKMNTNSRVVDVRKSCYSGKDSVRVELQDDNVGFIRCQMNKDSFNDLKFFDLENELKVNLFEIELENMNEVVLNVKKVKEFEKDKEARERLLVKQEKEAESPFDGDKQDKSQDSDGDQKEKKQTKGGKKKKQKEVKSKETKDCKDTKNTTTSSSNTNKESKVKGSTGVKKEQEQKVEGNMEQYYEDEVDDLLMFGNYDYNELVDQLKKYFNNPMVNVIEQPDNRLVILSSNNLFNIVIDNDNKTTVIEALNEEHRKYILKSMQKLMLTL